MSAFLLAALIAGMCETLFARTAALRPHRRHFRAMLALFWIVVLAIHIADRLNVASSLFFDGIPRFASDAATYQTQAAALADRLRSGSVTGFFDHQFFNYSRILGAVYLVFGQHTLVGNVFNAVFYMASVIAIFMIGRQMFSDRVGLLAAWIFACSPTFLLHDSQTLRWAATTAGLHLATLGTLLLVPRSRWPWGFLLGVIGFLFLVTDLPYIALLFVTVVSGFAFLTLLHRALGDARMIAAARIMVFALVLGTWYQFIWHSPDTDLVTRLRQASARHQPADTDATPITTQSGRAAERRKNSMSAVTLQLDQWIAPALLARSGFIADAGVLRRSGIPMGTAIEGCEISTFSEFVRNLPDAGSVALFEPTIPRLLSRSSSSSGLRDAVVAEMIFYYAVLVLSLGGALLALRHGGTTATMAVFILLLTAAAYSLLGTTILNGGTLHRHRQPYVAFQCVFASAALIWLWQRRSSRAAVAH